MIGLLARRTLTDRPRRTLLLLAGFGLSVGVMIVLLSIGQAVLEQSRDRDLVGGGDVVLLPPGVDVEVLEVGGPTGMYFTIDNARFVYRQVLSGPRFADRLVSLPSPNAGAPPLAAASPVLTDKVVYIRRRTAGRRPPSPRRALADGVIPSLERAVRGDRVRPDGTTFDWQDSRADRMWMDPPADSLYNDMDRFHVPPAGTRDPQRWAEWLYFNFNDPQTHAAGFLSLIVAGDPTTGGARAHSLLQLVWPGETPVRFDGDLPLGPHGFSTERVDLRFGDKTRAWFEGGAYHLILGWSSPAGEVRGALVVTPVADLYYPPFLIHASATLVSGYTVPALRAFIDGWIEAGGKRLVLQHAPAYHDHNWGTWRNVHWDWGTTANDAYGLFYGRVEHPDLRPGRAGAGIFAMLMQAGTPERRGGFMGLFRPDSIAYAWTVPSKPLPGNPSRVPRSLAFRADDDAVLAGVPAAEAGTAANGRTSLPEGLAVRMDVGHVLASPPRPGGPDLVFLQLDGTFAVEAVVRGRKIDFTAPGFAEVFVPGVSR